jgi:NADH:ubiquinone oxidoreductase subunit 5 (subunit L)/multisubunit Na+/H+ antiporter MnhA subunit
MVTAGIFMVARMSPLYELSETALSVVIVIGAITTLFMALVAIVQNDIKRVVAYSTLSQLGYMTVALGASAYAAGIFHLATHAFFKAVLFLGAMTIGPMLYGDWFGGAIAPSETMQHMKEEFHGWWPMVLHSLTSIPLWLALAGAGLAAFLYLVRPDLPAVIKAKSGILATILERKYGFDDFNDWFFAGGARRIGTGLWTWGDKTVIDGIMVNGTARLIGWFAGAARRLQTGYIYHYAFTMIFGVFLLLTLWLWHSRLY